MADVEHITDEQDMAAFDQLPRTLQDYLRQSPCGHMATPVLVYYRELLEKLTPLYSEYEVQQRMIRTLEEVERRQGYQKVPPLKARPGSKLKRPERRVRVPRRLLGIGDR